MVMKKAVIWIYIFSFLLFSISLFAEKSQEQFLETENEVKSKVCRLWKELASLFAEKYKEDKGIEKEVKQRYSYAGEGKEARKFIVRRKAQPEYTKRMELIENKIDAINEQFEFLKRLYNQYGKEWPGKEYFEKKWGKERVMQKVLPITMEKYDVIRELEQWLKGMKEETKIKIEREYWRDKREKLLKMSEDLL